MEHTTELLSVLLSHRVSAPYDERRCAAGHIEDLAGLVDMQGLLHNLMLTEQVVDRRRARKVVVEAASRLAASAGCRRSCGGDLDEGIERAGHTRLLAQE